MPFTKNCEIEARELIDAATRVRNFKSLNKAQQDEMLGEIVGETVKKEWKGSTIREWIAEYIINGYLTSATNITTNIASAATNTVLRPTIRELDTAIGKLMGTPSYEERRFGEGAIMLKAAIKNFGERMDFFRTGYVRGAPLDTVYSAKSFGATEKQFNDYTEKLGLEETQKVLFKQELYDAYGTNKIPGTIGKVLRQGALVGVGIDEANKAMFRRMEYDALAFRMAPVLAKRENISLDEAYKKLEIGNMSPADYQAKITQMLNKMGFESPVAEYNKLQNSVKEAVFQGEGGYITNVLSSTRAKYPLAGALIAPFVKVPLFIVNAGASVTPIVGLLHRSAKIDPATGLFKGTGFTVTMPERRNEWTAKQLLGIGAAAYIDSLVQEGILTGSIAEGDKPKFSFKADGEWYSYAAIEPIATLVGLSADMSTLRKQYELDPEAKASVTDDLVKYGKLYASAVAENITQKSFMEGFSKMFNAAVEPKTYLENFLESYATAVVPAGVAAVARTNDPYEREVNSFFDKVKARIPGLREELPVRYDITGQPMERSLGEVLARVKVKTPNAIQAALEESGYVFTPPDKKIRDVDITAEQISEHGKLAGAYFTEMMLELMNDKYFQAEDMSYKDLKYKQALSKARSAADDQMFQTLMETDPEFGRKYEIKSRMKKGGRDELLREQGRLQ